MLTKRNHHGSGNNLLGITRSKVISGARESNSQISSLNERQLDKTLSDDEVSDCTDIFTAIANGSPISLLSRNNTISNKNNDRLYPRNDFVILGAKAVLGSDASKTRQPENTTCDGVSDHFSSFRLVASSQQLQNQINCPNVLKDMQLGVLGNDRLNRESNMAQKNGDKTGWGSSHSPNGSGSYKDFGGNVSDMSQFSSGMSFSAQGPSSNGGNSCSNNGTDSNTRSSKPVLGSNKDSSCVQSNYMGWPGASSMGSSSSGKSWNIPNGGVGNGASNQQQSSASCNKYSEAGDLSYEGLIGATGGSDTPPGSDNHDAKMRNISSSSNWGILPPPRMGLLGGGETSINNNNGSWGAPPPPSTATGGWNGGNSANNNQWGSAGRQNNGNPVDPSNNSNQGLSSPKHNTWAQAAGKGLTSTGPTSHMGSVSNGSITGSQNEPLSAPAPKSKPNDDHVSEIKMAAAFSDGWGQLNVNQDSGWDVPLSPQASPKENNSSMWRAPANTGTEIWENNIRQRSKGGAAGTGNTASSASQPWGHHTPTTHIGGTWGEEEDTSNMWTGVPQNVNNSASNNNNNNNNNGGGPNGGNNNGWGNTGETVPNPNPNMWGNGGRDDRGERYNSGNDNKHWGSSTPSSSSWCEPGNPKDDQRFSHSMPKALAIGIAPSESRIVADCNTGPADPGTSVWGAPPQNKGNNMNMNQNHGGWGQSNMNNNPNSGMNNTLNSGMTSGMSSGGGMTSGMSSGGGMGGGMSGGGMGGGMNSGMNSGMGGGMNSGMSGGMNSGMSGGMNSGMNNGMGGGMNSGMSSAMNPSMNGNMNGGMGGGMNSGNPGNMNKGNMKEGPPSGWEEPSPPLPRRPATNFDDGTSLWGNPNRQVKVSHWKEMPTNKPNQMGGNGMPGNGPQGNMNMGNVGMPPGGGGGNSMGDGNQSMPPSGPGMIRLPSNAGGPNKMEMGPWNKAPRIGCGPGTWTDLPPHRDSPGPGKWDDPHTPNQMKGMPGTPTTPGSWGEPSSPLPPYWGAKPKNPANTWSEGQIDTSTWSGPAKQVGGGKPLSKELIWASKQFRLLTEIGFKKDDVENALRMTNMNFDEALGELDATCERELGDVPCNIMNMDGRGNKGRGGVNCSDDLGDRMHPNFGGTGYHNDVPSGPGGFQGAQGSGLNSNTPTSLLSNPAIGGQGSSLNLSTSINNMTPAMIQKIVQHQQQQQQSAQNLAQSFNATQSLNQSSLGNQPGRINQQNFPTAAQLRHLVQQIQMAVQAGHLNPQILNQPLAPQTLMLLYQLLQQIKALHQLQQQQVYQTQHLSKGGGGGGSGPGAGGPGNPSPLQLVNVQITQTKQRIVNYQNQIAAQQALFLKQQVVEPLNNHLPPHQGAQHLSGLHSGQPSSTDLFKPNMEPMQGLHNDFRDMNIKDPSPSSVPTSRLSQWKMSPMDKENITQQGPNNPNMANNGPPGHNSGNSSAGVNSGAANSNDFSRAPGSISKSGNPSSGISSNSSHSNPNSLHPLLTQGDSAWSSLPQSQGDTGGWPDSSNQQSGNPGGNAPERQAGNGSNNGGNDRGGTATSSNSTGTAGNGNNLNPATGGNYSSTDAKENSPGNGGNGTGSQGQPAYNITDLVPEFEPGKPWKGNSQMKNVEDDPHITPGSITQSPFSLNTIKEPELFNWSTVTSKSSPVSTTNSGGDSIVSSLTASLTSSTWAFTPPTTSLQSQTSTGNKQTNSKSNWSAVNESSDLWGGNVSKTRGPPPGLSGQGKNMGDPWNSSGSHTPSAGGRHSWGSPDANRSGVSPGWDRQNNSNFLVLRNLTPQIDGSTLKTLCVQHGPLQLFHLFLNHGHGIALVRYSSREEAAKAQSALNNCILGNTTIMVDVPTESEVAQYLQVANGGGPNGQSAGGLSSNQGVTNTVTGGWPNSQSQSTTATAVVGNQAVTPGFRGNNAGSNSSFQFGGAQANGPVGTSKMDKPLWNSRPTTLNMQSNHLWSYPGSASSLWGSPALEHHDQGSQSSLNSFLPEDLLGGESN